MLSGIAKYFLFSSVCGFVFATVFLGVFLSENSYASILKESGASDARFFIPFLLQNVQDAPEGFEISRVASDTAKALPADWLFNQQMSVVRGILAFANGKSLDAHISLAELKIALSQAFSAEYARTSSIPLSNEQIALISEQFMSGVPMEVVLTENDFPFPQMKGLANTVRSSQFISGIIAFVCASALMYLNGARKGLRMIGWSFILSAVVSGIIALAVWFIAPQLFESAPTLLKLFAATLVAHFAQALAIAAACCVLAAALAFGSSFLFKEKLEKLKVVP